MSFRCAHYLRPLRSKNGKIHDVWPRDSPSLDSRVEGERGQSVHASRPMSVSRLFGARRDIYIVLLWPRLILSDL